MSLNDWLTRRRLYTPDRIAVVDDDDGGRRYSYAELDRRATQSAVHLRNSLGVQTGDRVASLSTNRIEYLDLYFACGKIGAILAPFNVRLPSPAICEMLEDCRPRVLLYESAFADIAEQAQSEQPGLETGLLERIGAAPKSRQDRPPTSASFEVPAADESDTAMILFTSGTTGRAKGAMISYRQIHWNALNTIIGLQLTQDDAAFLNMPLYHTGGWHVLFTPLMLIGGRVILQKRFDAECCNQRLGPEGVTILFGVPTTLRMMQEADSFKSADFSSVRFAIFGGESCPLPVIEAYAQRGVAMRQGYGLTEAGPNCFSLPAGDAIRKQGSIGFPNFHVDVRLLKEDGREADTGEVGELLMRGPHLFSGYWRSPGETAQVLADGWLATGDLMTRDEDGYYYVVGRKKEMYVSGGENVYPAQVERILNRHPAVALSAVIGMPDAKWGEAGWAWVQLQPQQTAGEDELRNWCRRHLAAFQCPARFIFVDALPMGHSGKIDKVALAARAGSLS